jgi:6-phosphogluconolactonase (cycloisomerase 2 family)
MFCTKFLSSCALISFFAAGAFGQTVSLSHSTLSFSSQVIGTSSGSKPVTLTNTSKTASLTITSIVASGDFGETDNCVSPIAPLGTCTLNLSFSPNATGAIDGSVTITDNAANSPHLVNLTGTAIGPVSFSPASLSFPSTAIGATSSPKTVTVTNKQSTTLTVNGAIVSGDYAILSDTCPGSLSTGGTCTVQVTFKPSVSGTISGALTLTDSAADSPEIVPLSGKGTGTVTNPVSFSPTSLTFSSQQTSTISNGKTITLTNKGTSSLTIGTVIYSGDYSETDTCAGQTIAFNGTCSITVKFSPSATGTIKGAISVSDDAVTSPQVVALSGTGVGALVFSPSTLAFGIEELCVGGSLNATLTNYSSSAVNISNIAVSGHYSQTNTCGTSIAAGRNCTFTVSALPTANGTLDGAVTVTDGGANSPQVLSLNSTGTNPPRFAYLSDNTTLVAYTVNPVTSQLRAVQSIAQPTTVVTGNIFVPPSNKFLYVPVGAAVGSPIYGYSINATGGYLTPLTGSPFASVTGAGGMSFTTNGNFAFAAGSFYGSNQVESFSVNATTGALTSIGTQPSGNVPCGQAIVPSNKFFYVPDCEVTGTIYGYSVNTTTGALTALAGSPFSGHENNAGAFVHPNGKFLLVEGWANSANNYNAPVSVYTINATTGALAEVPGSPFAGGGNAYADVTATDPTGRFIFVAMGPSQTNTGVLLGYSINLTTGALSPLPGSPYTIGSFPTSVVVDPTGKYLYVSNNGSGPTAYTFSINSSTGALTQIDQQGTQGAGGNYVALATGTAPVTYTPSFAYVTNQTSKSISEFTINDSTGALTAVAGSPLADSNGPQAVAASPNDKFLYTANSNGSISEYKVGSTGALTKVSGSPLTGLGNPVSLVVDPTSGFLLVVDQTNKALSSYTINSSTGALSLLNSVSTATSPTVVALDPLGVQALVAEGTATLQYFPISLNGTIGSPQTYTAGATPVASSIDPTSQHLFQVNTNGNLACVYTLLETGVQSGAPCYNTGNLPSAVLAEPSGRFVYVANSADNNISAYSLNTSNGVLTPIAGTFTTGSGPDSLSASNDGKYLYVTNKSSGTVSIFTINSDGTLTAAGSATTATGPTSIATVGTYK